MKFNKLTTATIKFINAWPVGVNLSFLTKTPAGDLQQKVLVI